MIQFPVWRGVSSFVKTEPHQFGLLLLFLLLSCYSKTGRIHYCQRGRPWRKHFRQWWSRLAECLQQGLANRTLDTLDGTVTLKPQSVVLVATAPEDREMQITLQQFRRRGVHGEVFQYGELRFTSISGIRSITTQTTNGCIVFVPGGHCAREHRCLITLGFLGALLHGLR